MKNKHLFISNFKYNSSNKSDSFNNLIIEDSFNANINNDFIESEFSETKILEEIYNKALSDEIELNNKIILESSSKIIPYEFFDENLKIIQTRLFLIDFENNFYELNRETNLFELIYKFNSFPKEILSNNTLYFFDNINKCLVVENDNLVSIENIPYITSFVYDSTNLYFTVKNIHNKLFISEPCELKELSTNLEQYSSISTTIEDGSIFDIINLKENIFIFAKYSILKLDLENNKTLRQNKLDFSIFENSINQLDDYTVFYTSDGLYYFDGTDTTQIFDNYLNISKNANFIYFNNNLYILSLNFENIIFKYNLANKVLYKLKFENLLHFYKTKTLSDYFLSVHYNGNKSISSIYGNKNSITYPEQNVIFKTTFLNSLELKQINKIFIKSEGSFQLKISSDISSVILYISNSNEALKLCLNGNYFNFEIYSNSKTKINSILISYSEVGD